MDKKIIDILTHIEEKGFNAYIVGGFVRDNLLGKHSFDVDICTNALPKDIFDILENINVVEEYGAVKLKVDKYNIDITTFRKKSKYKNGVPVGIEYVNDLKSDLKRRDFTINTICLDKDFNIYDYEGGLKDMRAKLIKTVGKAEDRFKEDPTRILRALRFMITLGFKLDDEIEEYIINNKDELPKISITKKKDEISKILLSNNIYDFIKFIKKRDLEKYLGIKFNKIKRTNNLVGMWAQVELLEDLNFTKVQTEQINSIKKLVQKGSIDKYDIYKYGNFITTIAGTILNKNVRKLNKIFDSLPIKEVKDINISAEEICEILKITPSKELGDIIKVLEKEIIDFKLQNKYDLIVKRLYKLKEEL